MVVKKKTKNKKTRKVRGLKPLGAEASDPQFQLVNVVTALYYLQPLGKSLFKMTTLEMSWLM